MPFRKIPAAENRAIKREPPAGICRGDYRNENERGAEAIQSGSEACFNTRLKSRIASCFGTAFCPFAAKLRPRYSASDR